VSRNQREAQRDRETVGSADEADRDFAVNDH
jgi:hypothetical protein